MEEQKLGNSSDLIERMLANNREVNENQQRLIGVLFNLMVGVELYQRRDNKIALEQSKDVAMLVLDNIHHDRLDKTLGEVIRDLNMAEVHRAFEITPLGGEVEVGL